MSVGARWLLLLLLVGTAMFAWLPSDPALALGVPAGGPGVATALVPLLADCVAFSPYVAGL